MFNKILAISILAATPLLTACASFSAAPKNDFTAPFGLTWGSSPTQLADRLSNCKEFGPQIKCELKTPPRPLAHPGDYNVWFAPDLGLTEAAYNGQEATAADLKFVARHVRMLNEKYPESEKANWVLYDSESADTRLTTQYHNQDLICGRDRYLCIKSIWRYTLPTGGIYIETGNYYNGKYPSMRYYRDSDRADSVQANAQNTPQPRELALTEKLSAALKSFQQLLKQKLSIEH